MKPTSGNKLFRRLIALQAVVLIWIVVIWTWVAPPDIPTSTVTAMGIVVGLLATALGLYQWSRAQDDKMAQIYRELKR